VTSAPATSVEHLLRELAPQVLGALVRRHGNFDDAEDAVQEAVIAASARWPSKGVPSNPRGWLYHVAVRRIADQVRSELARQKREERVTAEVWAEWAFVSSADRDVAVEEDDSLSLLFLCCHPSLTPASAIALTLRAVGGLTTAEIANAFLVPEATMAQRISRAKQTVRSAGARFAPPSADDYSARLASVLHVLYLLFNEGYVTSVGAALQRVDLVDEAVRLTRMLRALRPRDGEVLGLLALMLLTDARRAARTGSAGELIPLDEQDRSRWDRERIAEGAALVEQAFALGPPGYYSIQAAIAALHDEAPSTADTDWREILALYSVLEGLSDNPMVALNRIIALAMVEGAPAALEQLDALIADARIAGHYRVDAVRGHLLLMQGERAAAAGCFARAAQRTASVPERDYLLSKAASVRA
jgi:RNA polymerase sigma factor (sigma-70 family)